MIGKTNLDEFAMGSSTENSAFGPSRNPWNVDCTPGGSSGGSAVAVAARLVPAALGSDTGGSIRQPAALTGIVGLKPTYGRVSRYGLLAFASSLDQIGPFTTTAADAALVLTVIAGADPHDATAAPESVPAFSESLTGLVDGLRIGVPRRVIAEGVESSVKSAFDRALEVFAARGATLVDVELPHAAYAIPIYYLIATAEASSNLARYDGVRYGLRAVSQGRHAADDVRPDAGRRLWRRSEKAHHARHLRSERRLLRRVLPQGAAGPDARSGVTTKTHSRRVDVVAMPTTPTPAFRLGEKTADPLQMYLADVFTVSANLAGFPAVSIPCGFSPERLPIGLQLTGRMFDEATILRAADAYQRDTRWHMESPDERRTKTKN